MTDGWTHGSGRGGGARPAVEQHRRRFGWKGKRTRALALRSSFDEEKRVCFAWRVPTGGPHGVLRPWGSGQSTGSSAIGIWTMALVRLLRGSTGDLRSLRSCGGTGFEKGNPTHHHFRDQIDYWK